MIRHAIAVAALIACSMSSPAVASYCGNARERYSQALDGVSYALRRYTNFLFISAGTDDCSSEFRRLKYAQDELESTVSEIVTHREYRTGNQIG